MKVVAAYLLAVLGGKTTPTAEDIKDILGFGRKKKADAIAEAANLMEMESSEKKMTSETFSSPKPNFEDPMKLNPSRTWITCFPYLTKIV
ncbi:hypothetical protein ACFX1Q_024240 [Malus domestica]